MHWRRGFAFVVSMVPCAALAQGVVLNEIQYNPPSGDQFEFIELFNDSNVVVDLSGWKLERAVQFTFPAGAEIAAGGFVVVANDRANFSIFHNVPAAILYGDYGLSLASDGETLRLEDASGATRDQLRYSGSVPWPVTANGGGQSLQRRCADASSGSVVNWTAANPTPAAANTGRQCPPPTYSAPPVVINEIFYNSLAHPDSLVEYVELRNTRTQSIDISAWSFTDGLTYTFPAATVIPPGGFVVVASNVAFLRDEFGATNVLGDFAGDLADGGERIELSNELGVPQDAVKYSDGGTWADSTDGLGFSLEKLVPTADGWDHSSWRSALAGSSLADFIDIEVTGTATSSNLHIYLDGEGEVLIDDVSLTPESDENVERIAGGDLETGTPGWSVTSSHDNSRAQPIGGVDDSGCLRIIATGAGGIADGSTSVATATALTIGVSYTVRLKAKLLVGDVNLVVALDGSSVGVGLFDSVEIDSARSPGRENTIHRSTLPPFVLRVRHTPRLPVSTDEVVVAARVESVGIVESVELTYRTGTSTGTVTMRDDGQAPDDLSGDLNYAAALPSFSSGTIVRYSITTRAASGSQWTDGDGNDPTGSYAFHVQDDRPVSPIRVYDLRGDDDVNALSCVDYATVHFIFESDIYLNVGVRNRGGCDPEDVKRPLRLRFNRRRDFRGERRFNLNDLWEDKSLVREEVATDVLRAQTLPYCKTRHVRVHQNGHFHGVFLDAENPGSSYLARNGLDPKGTLYLSDGGAEERHADMALYAIDYTKRTNRDGDFTGLAAFLGGLDTVSAGGLLQWLHESVDVEAEIDYQTAVVATASVDHIDDNHTLYEDPLTGIWQRSLVNLGLTYGRSVDADFGDLNDFVDVEQVDLFYGSDINRLTMRFFEATGPSGLPYFERAFLGRLWSHLQEKSNERLLDHEIEKLRERLRDEAADDLARWGRYPPQPEPEHSDDFCDNIDELLDVGEFAGDGFVRQRFALLRVELAARGYTGHARVRITEIMYHPLLTDDHEFLELRNTESTSVDVSGWCVHPANYTFPAGTTLAPGEIVLVVRDVVQFTALYPGVPGRRFGPYTGKLRNGGGTVRLYDGPLGTLLPTASFPPRHPVTIDSVKYADGGDWPLNADGGGHSLEVRHVALDNDLADSWRSSTAEGGSPGIIVQIDLPPSIDLSMSRSGGVSPLTVNFDASGSFDPDGDAVSASWQFGDGQTAGGLTVAHSYSNAGTYIGTLSIVAGGSSPVTRSFKVRVRSSAATPSFIRGDTNGDGSVDVSDVVWLLRYNFSGGSPPPCIKTADLNDDAGADVSDAVFLLNYLFRAGQRILSPFPECGEDPTPNSLTCESSSCP